MSTIPTISKHDIGTFVGEQNFLKGKQHVRDGAIVNPEQQAMVHFPNHIVYGSHSMALVSLLSSAPVLQAHRHLELADANTLLHYSLHGMSNRKRSPKWMTSIPFWNDRAKPS